MRKPTKGQQVTVEGRDEVLEVESAVGDYVWCTWTEGGQIRRDVFNRKKLALTNKTAQR